MSALSCGARLRPPCEGLHRGHQPVDRRSRSPSAEHRRRSGVVPVRMNVFTIIGIVVVVMVVLSYLGLR
jgi:hypothetical protein